MASLTGTKIKDTYVGLLKTIDNAGIGATAKQLTDGLGTGSPLYVSTANIGVGVSPTANIGNLQIGGSAQGSLFAQQGTDTVRAGVRATGRTGIALDSSDATYINRMWYIDNIGSSGKLVIGRSGLDVATFDNSGNVGINVSPLAQFHVASSNLNAQADGTLLISKGNFTAGNQKHVHLELRLGTTKCLNVGSYTDVSGNGGSFIDVPVSALGLSLQTGGTERMRITSGGELLYASGGAEPSATQIGLKIGVGASGTFINNAKNVTTSTSHFNFFNPNGIVGTITTSGSSTAYNTSSDYRLKEDWQPMSDALTRIDALKPVNFAWKADGSRVDGFLAHELQEVIPEAVTGEKDATEEYEVTPAEYKTVVVTPAQEAVYETIEHPAIVEELDADGNIIVEAQEAWTEEVLVSEAVEEVTEQVLVSEAVMGTRPVYQGIDQSKIVPLLVAAIQELRAEVEALKGA